VKKPDTSKIGFFHPDGRMIGCWVYSILCQDHEHNVYVKVGMAFDWWERIQAVKVGCPFNVESVGIVELPGREKARLVEQSLLRALIKWHTRGEWFRLLRADNVAFRDICAQVFARHQSPSWPLAWRKLDRKLLDDIGRLRYQEREARKSKYSPTARQSLTNITGKE
jgi:hypothetical protein